MNPNEQPHLLPLPTDAPRHEVLDLGLLSRQLTALRQVLGQLAQMQPAVAALGLTPAEPRVGLPPADDKPRMTAMHWKIMNVATHDCQTPVQLVKAAGEVVIGGKIHSGWRQVFADLVRWGKLVRPKRGLHRLPAPGEGRAEG